MTENNSILRHLNDKGFVVSKVRGTSMWPLLNQKHTTIYVQKEINYAKNDCILFLRDNGELIMHRILKVHHDVFLVSGDNQCILERVTPNQIQGKMIEYYKHGKTKKLQGFMYRLYVCIIHLTRPLRCLRDLTKRIIKSIIRR